MRVHVVYGHPVADGFAAALHRTVLDGLARGGHDVDDLDLYAERFSPALSEAERRGYDNSPANEVFVTPCMARLRAAEALVFCFPTWWYATPAIVKGYLDRVMLPGVAFHLPQDGGDIAGKRGSSGNRKFDSDGQRGIGGPAATISRRPATAGFEPTQSPVARKRDPRSGHPWRRTPIGQSPIYLVSA